MKIRVIEPSVQMLTSELDARKALAMCAYGAGISRGRVHDVYAVASSNGYEEIPEFCAFVEPRSFEQAERLVGKLLKKNPPHKSVLKHGSVDFLITGSRIMTHELVRHHVGVAFTQMSTRYIEEKDTVTLVRPPGLDGVDTTYHTTDTKRVPKWVQGAWDAVTAYRLLRARDIKRESARYLLPHCLASSVLMSANFLACRQMIADRTQIKAAPEIKGIFETIREQLRIVSPVLVEGL